MSVGDNELGEESLQEADGGGRAATSRWRRSCRGSLALMVATANIETSVVSYLMARLSQDVVAATYPGGDARVVAGCHGNRHRRDQRPQKRGRARRMTG